MEKWVGEKFKSLPAERQEAIRKQVAVGAEASKVRFEEGVAFRASLRAGRDHLVEAGLPVIEMNLNGYRVMGVVQWETNGRGKVAYAICSPKDTYSKKVGRGLVGLRLKEGGTKFGMPAGEYQTIRGAKVEILRAILNSCSVPPKMFSKLG